MALRFVVAGVFLRSYSPLSAKRDLARPPSSAWQRTSFISTDHSSFDFAQREVRTAGVARVLSAPARA